jgi:2-dehydro-3-deoxyphosphogluconate aldolase/(4S)-4-hydroxy-2-oxoglutarate aldolase
VLTPDEVRAVAEAGGRFVLSPVFDRAVVDEAHRLGLLAVPGASTPTEILAAHRHGARMVKVFPAAALGGAAYLRAIRGPLPDIPLVPTNGITAATIADYVAAGAVVVGVGGEVFPPNFTLDHVEAASRRVRHAMDAARR